MEQLTHIIDAKGMKLGRVASKAALLLRGKNEVTWRPHRLPVASVKIINAKSLNINPSKKTSKIYRRHSGYPGGLKEETLAAVIAKKGEAEALRRAVRGMLPANRLRPLMLKQLKIED